MILEYLRIGKRHKKYASTFIPGSTKSGWQYGAKGTECCRDRKCDLVISIPRTLNASLHPLSIAGG
jgi:hypothetical protein